VLEIQNTGYKDTEIIQQDLHSAKLVLFVADAIQYDQVCGHAPSARNAQHTYVMENQALVVVTEEKDLGVTVCNNLKLARQCQLVYAKASKALGLISRTISFKRVSVLLKLYKSLVRLHLEYYVSAWSPYYEKDRFLLERIQHRFPRMIPSFKDERIRQLGLWTLEERRNRADLLQIFKMYKGLSSAKFSDFFALSMSVTTRLHTAKIAKCRCHLDVRHFFFFSRVIDQWNRLQQSVIDSNSVNCFTNGLEHTRKTSMGFFMD